MPEIPKVPGQNIQPIPEEKGKKGADIPAPEETTLPKTSEQKAGNKTEKELARDEIEKTAMPESTIKKILGIIGKKKE
jgi:hypothetical protein